MPSSKHEPRKDRRRIRKGRQYEDLAARFYADLGFDILDRNWRAGRKEIDLIVQRGDLVAFVEVKSSSSKRYGHPVERVDKKKIAHLSDCAHRYIEEHDLKGVDLRFDVVTFVDGRLEHFPNAFEVE